MILKTVQLCPHGPRPGPGHSLPLGMRPRQHCVCVPCWADGRGIHGCAHRVLNPLGNVHLPGGLIGPVSRLATLVPSVRQGLIAHALLASKRNPRGMGPGPPFAPNNHSEFMDFFRSLKSNDVLGQGQKTCLLVIIHTLETLVTSGEVKYLLGQL